MNNLYDINPNLKIIKEISPYLLKMREMPMLHIKQAVMILFAWLIC